MRSSLILRVFLFIMLAVPLSLGQAGKQPASSPKAQPRAVQFNQFSNPHVQFLDTSGRPLAGGRVFTYAAGTTTPVPTFRDSTGTAVNTNPVILDSGGFGDIWLDQTKSYKVVLQNAQGVQQWSVDNISGAISGSSVPLSSITNGVLSNTINSGDNRQNWLWQLTGSSAQAGMAFMETAPSTALLTSALVEAHTLDGSTVNPFCATHGAAYTGLCVDAAGKIVAINGAVFAGSLEGDVTGNADTATEVPLSGLANAISENLLLNGGNTQFWEWQLSGATAKTGIGFIESAPSTAIADSALVEVHTLDGSTIQPFCAGVGTAWKGLCVGPNGNIYAQNGAQFLGPLVGTVQATNITGAAHCVEADVTGNLIPGGAPPCGTGGGLSLSNIAAATTNNAINNGNNPQAWFWQLTGTSPEPAFAFAEPVGAPSTNTGLNSSLLAAITEPGSTIWPFRAIAHTGTNYGGFGVTPAGDVQVFGSSSFLGPLVGKVTGDVSGTASNVTGVVAIAHGGTGTATPSLVAGNNITVTGGWPNQTINSIGGASGVTSVTGVPPIASTGGLTPAISLNNTAVTPGSYTNLNATIDAQGRVTAASNGTGGGGMTWPGLAGIANYAGSSAWGTSYSASNPIPINFGGTGTSTPGLVAGGNITITGPWPNQTINSTAAAALSSLTPATATHIINNANFPQVWQWALTGATQESGLSITEPTASTNTNAASTLVNISTLAGSTIAPLGVTNTTGSSQVHFGTNPFGAGGGYLSSQSPNNVVLSAGARSNGSTWIAEAPIATQLALGGSGNISLLSDSGLTVGNTFTPTIVASVSNTGQGSFNGGLHVGASVVAGTGMQHKRTVSCTTAAAANAQCATVITWNVPFIDANYTVSCTSGGPLAMVINIPFGSVLAASISVNIMNIPGSVAATSANLDCISMHD